MISSEVWNCCLGIIKLSIGIDTSAAIFGIMRFNETKELRFKIVGVTQGKRPFSNGLFSIQSEGLACNLTAGEYVIAEGVWHHSSACILLRIDYIQHFVLIPYRRQAADFIHGFAVIL